MPHNGYADILEEEVYTEVGKLCDKGKQLKRRLLVGGDWNAVGGPRADGDAEKNGWLQRCWC